MLKINWPYGPEFIDLANIERAPQKIKTIERWVREKGKPWVSYNVDVTKFRPKQLLCLSYKETDQNDANVIKNARWGKSIIKWNPSGNVEAEWLDDHDKSWNRSRVSVTELGASTRDTLRKSVSVIVKMRPNQRALRDALLLLDEACVLTGEAEKCALEAAHIVPVKAEKEDNDHSANAILLRADLHRLFDAGLIWFDLSKNAATVRFDQCLSAPYKKILRDKKLSDNSFRRVELALRKRLKLRDSKGSS